jgi:hypothetical protein
LSRPHGLSRFAIRRRGAGSSRRLGSPSRAYHGDPAGTLRGSGNPHGVSFPYSDMDAEVHQPGFPRPVRSAFRVSHPLDGLLPPTRSDHEDRYRSWGSSLQSLSPPQSLAPSGFLTLLSFLTSRPPALRTRRSRCPATPGPYSLRRSVPDSVNARTGRCSHGISYSSDCGSLSCWRQWPGTRLLRQGRRSPRASRPGAQGRGSRGKIGFHRSDQPPKSVHQDLSPGSPGDSSVLSDYSDFK